MHVRAAYLAQEHPRAGRAGLERGGHGALADRERPVGSFHGDVASQFGAASRAFWIGVSASEKRELSRLRLTMPNQTAMFLRLNQSQRVRATNARSVGNSPQNVSNI